MQIAAAEPVIIEKTHHPFAVLMSYDEYERLKRLDLENEYWGKKALQAEAEGYIGESDSLKFIQAAAGGGIRACPLFFLDYMMDVFDRGVFLNRVKLPGFKGHDYLLIQEEKIFFKGDKMYFLDEPQAELRIYTF